MPAAAASAFLERVDLEMDVTDAGPGGGPLGPNVPSGGRGPIFGGGPSLGRGLGRTGNQPVAGCVNRVVHVGFGMGLDLRPSVSPPRPGRRLFGVVLGAALLAGWVGIGVPATTAGAASSHGTFSGTLRVAPSCRQAALTAGALAVTRSGDVVAVNSRTWHTQVVALGVNVDGGISVRPELDAAYVTAPGPGGEPAIWRLSLTSCRARPEVVEVDAEMPSVSPDGGHLGFVTLDDEARQTGVALVHLGALGAPDGALLRFRAKSTPPPLPITGIAVGKDAGTLAVWGGFIDSYLGRKHPTVGTLNPREAKSLHGLRPVLDGEGVSMPNVRPGTKPESWQSAPVFLANGEFLVGGNGGGIEMPFRDTTPGLIGGGIRNVLRTAFAVRSIAAGPRGTVLWVTANGILAGALHAVDLPFGPEASTPPATSAPVMHVVKGAFASVAWTAGLSTQATSPPPVFHTLAHLPSVVGLSEPKAAAVMKALEVPVFVGHTVSDPSVPNDTVLAQDPPAGVGMACQCSVALTVSSGG